MKKSGGAVQNIWMRDESPACTWRPGTVRATHPRDNVIQVGGHGGGRGLCDCKLYKNKRTTLLQNILNALLGDDWLIAAPPITCQAAGTPHLLRRTCRRSTAVHQFNQEQKPTRHPLEPTGARREEEVMSRRRSFPGRLPKPAAVEGCQ